MYFINEILIYFYLLLISFTIVTLYYYNIAYMLICQYHVAYFLYLRRFILGIVERIQVLCEINSINFRKLEQELDFANGSIRRWNDTSPSCDKIQRVAKRFDKSIDWIVTGQDIALDLHLSDDQRTLLENYEKLDVLDKEKIKSFIEISLINLH